MNLFQDMLSSKRLFDEISASKPESPPKKLKRGTRCTVTDERRSPQVSEIVLSDAAPYRTYTICCSESIMTGCYHVHVAKIA